MTDTSPKFSGEPTAKSLANGLATLGRYGDSYMVHAAEGETVVPKEVLELNPGLKDNLFKQMKMMGIENPDRYVVGNEFNSINPITGQPEFFFKKVFRAVKKVAKKILPIAAPIIGNLIAPGVGGILASGITTKLTGGSMADAFKSMALSYGAGAIGRGLTSGITSAAAPGGGNLGPFNFSGKDFFTGLQSGLTEPFSAGANLFSSGAQNPLAQGIFGPRGAGLVFQGLSQTNPAFARQPFGGGTTIGKIFPSYQSNPIQSFPDLPNLQGTQGDAQFIGQTNQPSGSFSGGTPSSNRNLLTMASSSGAGGEKIVSTLPLPNSSDFVNLNQSQLDALVEKGVIRYTDQGPEFVLSKMTGSPSVLSTEAIPTSVSDPMNPILSGDYKGIPSLQSTSGSPLSGRNLGDIIKRGPDSYEVKDVLNSKGTGFERKLVKVAAEPQGMFNKFGEFITGGNLTGTPATIAGAGAAGLGLYAATNALGLNEQEATVADQMSQLDAANPRRLAYVQWQGIQDKNSPEAQALKSTWYGTPSYTTAQLRNLYGAGPISGITSVAAGGEIVGPGTGTSDSIPAMLSDGEFVMTAKAVRNAGNGNRDVGAARMYDMMNRFERGTM